MPAAHRGTEAQRHRGASTAKDATSAKEGQRKDFASFRDFVLLFLCARCVLCGEYKVLFFFLRLSGERSRLTSTALRISNFILMKIAFLAMAIMGLLIASHFL